ncbi:MAG: T9SS type A sorting domain-containing protein [candidate division Zixibacteria bacterium]|nr:T9SS type A sorting domain-containing protein [candidate division Zixibacteria bacterium]
MKRYKSLIIPLMMLLCAVLMAPFAAGQSGNADYQMTNSGLVGGGGVSGNTNYIVTGTFGFGPMGVSTSSSYILNGGFAAAVQQADVFSASYIGEAVDTVPIAPITLTVEYGNAEGAVTGKFYYRLRGGVFPDSATMTAGTGNTLTYTVPTSLLTPRGLDYYFAINDAGSGVTRTINNSGAGYTFICEMTNAQGQCPTALPEAQYKIVGIPINHQGSRSVRYIFGDDLGAIDNTQWRLGRYEYDYDGDSLALHEYLTNDPLPNIAEHQPGIGYWLAVRHGKRFGTDGYSVTPNRLLFHASYYELALDSGWNQLANPFAFPIDWNSVLFDDDGTVVAGHPAEILDDFAYYYDYTDKTYKHRDSLPAWEGFFVNIKKNNVKILFHFFQYMPPLASAGKIFEPVSTDNWQINFQLVTAGYKDADNYVGVKEKAKTGYDNYDFAEPPPPPGGAYLAFSVPEQKGLYRCDYRPAFENGAEWKLNFAKATDRVLTVDDLDQLPNNMEAVLIFDNDTRFELTERTEIKLNDPIQTARLIIGTRNYIDNEISELLPKSFILEQNYPNPFNPVTSITFSLPEPGLVLLEVFNVLGQNVRNLVDREMAAGTYVVDWDSKDDNGNPVASGVYFYRIEYNDVNQCRKMVLLK